MNPRDVLPLIEGEPYISTVLVEPGLTNWKVDRGSSRIAGLNAEHADKNEGLVRFDISIRKDVSVMCNLSQGIKEAGIAEGMAESKWYRMIQMYLENF